MNKLWGKSRDFDIGGDDSWIGKYVQVTDDLGDEVGCCMIEAIEGSWTYFSKKDGRKPAKTPEQMAEEEEGETSETTETTEPTVTP